MSQPGLQLTNREKRQIRQAAFDSQRYILHLLAMRRFKIPWETLSPYQQFTVRLMYKKLLRELM